MSEDFEFQKRLIHQFSAILDGMKTLNSNISENISAIGRFESEFTKLSRQNTQVRGDVLEMKSEHTRTRSEIAQFRSDFAQFQTDVTHRFDALVHRLEALLHRMEEIENTIDGNSEHIREMRIELRSQYNDILTALQGGLQNTIGLSDLTERVEALERRAGM